MKAKPITEEIAGISKFWQLLCMGSLSALKLYENKMFCFVLPYNYTI